jgi:hypothetical protein
MVAEGKIKTIVDVKNFAEAKNLEPIISQIKRTQ